MFWIQPQGKYNQPSYVAYNGEMPEHFCPAGENWGAFTPAECQQIISLAAQYPEKIPTISGDGKGMVESDYRSVRVWYLPYSQDLHWLWSKVINNVGQANQQYWNFDLYGIIEPMQLLCYDGSRVVENNKDHYDKHLDVGIIAPNRKLTFSIQLTDPKEYDGAELNIYRHRNPEQIPTAQGSMILFPSYMLHEVTPITRGKRWALVCWVSGPQYR